MIARWLSGVALSIAPYPAYAHSPIPGIEGFYTGLIHPFSTPAQALLMLGLGLLVGGFPPLRARWPLCVFLPSMIVGMLVSNIIGQSDLEMFTTTFAACALAALAIAFTAIGGIWMGSISLADPGPLRDRIITTLGAFIGANLGLLYIFGISDFIRGKYTWPSVPIAFRIVSAWVGAISLLMLALLFAPEQT
ncbi:HupE/UreJ family protein [Falsihalocynthiibacter arcticus]|uniref:Uncharacterized protein n=1 Tax=Falsihalocynthiibacter arcticus TaxID=1579316 RepID=A0A126V527_9RHOB|nr:HupE/UreJ family protein [Falsihalocynthiibacter arcticus]AML53408.1 hypothetical protein RC74_21035 [Falsihalocynthiibacter arcticus]